MARLALRLGVAFAAALAAGAPARAGRVVIDLSAPVKTFTPKDAFGGAIDGMQRGDVLNYLSPYNVGRIREAGLRRVTYRIRTELGIEAWHWSSEGSWSDPEHSQGYWTSSDHPSASEDVTWGYSLPRRGDTSDQANDTGYSRIDDGDAASFWKSNPYLDRRYTGLEQNRPQWIVVDFQRPTPVDAARIQWGTPWAVRYAVQYWSGESDYDRAGRWRTLPQGAQQAAGAPSDQVVRLAARPVVARAFRILLLESSETAPPGSTDVRDRLGYAVRELSLGTIGADGRLKDAVRHGLDQDTQTLIQVSSTDPWHRAVDKDPDTEQPGFDLIYRSGVTDGLPPMIPVGVLYDTPENAAAEIRYLKARGYPIGRVELGEEPDGQFISPEDYADLYLETAQALHRIDPALDLGGPSMQGATTTSWPDPEAGWSWTGRFIGQLKARSGLRELGFFSFEHYPFDSLCGPLQEKLLRETALLDQAVKQTRAEGVDVPLVISEYGFSPFSGGAMSQVEGALLDVDVVGQFLTLGGDQAFMFGYPPDTPLNQLLKCAGWGNMMLYDADGRGQARNPMPQFWAHQMMTRDWASPAEAPHRLYRAKANVRDAEGRPLVVAYPLLRPDGEWAVMLINRDAKRAHPVRIAFHDQAETVEWGSRGGLAVVQYSKAQYSYRDIGRDSQPVRDLPPQRFRTGAGQAVGLPPMSLTIVRGSGPRS